MDKTTHEIRIANWRSIIEQCHARPEGQTAKQWLADNGISEKSYYYWQRKIRQETYSLISSDAASIARPEPAAFAELPFISPKNDHQAFSPDAVIRRGQTALELCNTISDRLLDRLMEVISHA